MIGDSPILELRSMAGSTGAWPAEHDPANPAALPDYDDWGWDDYWGPAEWMQWHKTMKAAIGKEKADYNFATAWEKMLSADGLGSSVLSARSFNVQFREWAKSENLLNALYGGMAWLKPLGAATDLASGAADLASGAADIGSKAPDVAMSVVKWAAIAIGIGLGVAAIKKSQRLKKRFA